MDPTPTERVFRRDRAVVLGTIAAVTALAWAYLVWLARMDMGGMEMGGTEMGGTEMPGTGSAMPGMGVSGMDTSGSDGAGLAELAGPALATWSATQFAAMFLMWSIMMIGMMLPSVAPMVLIHARVAREALRRGRTFAATGWFAGGYLLAWIGFSLAATGAQWALERAALLSPMTMSTGTHLGGLILIAAGLYQWTPLKEACLAHCQAPLVFIQHHGGFSPHPGGALRLGLRHGLYCIGCCWVLMALLFAVGVMNLLWVAGIAAFVLLEKVAPIGRILPRVAGLALIAIGATMLL